METTPTWSFPLKNTHFSIFVFQVVRLFYSFHCKKWRLTSWALTLLWSWAVLEAECSRACSANICFISFWWDWHRASIWKQKDKAILRTTMAQPQQQKDKAILTTTAQQQKNIAILRTTAAQSLVHQQHHLKKITQHHYDYKAKHNTGTCNVIYQS